MNNILFLDVDGVLNSTRAAMAFKGYGSTPQVWQTEQAEIFKMTLLDPVAMGLLAMIINDGQLQVVISSAWRTHDEELDKIIFNRVFATYGVPECVVGSTPRLPGPAMRGDEIKAWLDKHPDVTKYVILDDNSDMLPDQMNRFVQTDPSIGLGYIEYQQVMAIVSEKTKVGETVNG